MIRLKFVRIRGVEYIDSEIGLYECDYNYFWEHYGRYNVVNCKNLFEYLFYHNIEIDNDYIDLARKHFINELHLFNIFEKPNLFIHYYDKFELNKSLTCISYLLDKNINNPNILERLKNAINELSYKDFLNILNFKMNDIHALYEILLYANPNYVEEKKR